jgi:putative ABC transport system substrate-binding protein
MTTRRKLLAVLGIGALAAPIASFGQQQRPKVARIGLLESASNYVKGREALITGLRELGLVDGKNILIEYRWAEGQYERLPRLVGELVQMKVDVIVASTAPAIRAAQQGTATIPIVMVRNADPIGSGFVTSLSRPGRNITGLSNINIETVSKYLELLRAAAPKLQRVAVLTNPGNLNHANFLKRIDAADKTNSVRISPAQAGTESQIEAAFGVMK